MTVQCDESNRARPGSRWLRTLVVGRRPKLTAIRIAVLVITCIITFKFILLPIRLDGISMLPTYHTGQINFINRLAYLRHAPHRGDIVSVELAPPERFMAPSVMLMKRIIALPGETLSFQDGRAFINGQPLNEPYLKEPCDWEQQPITCGPDEYYVVGDNRSMPIDLHTKGRAKLDHIVGKLLL